MKISCCLRTYILTAFILLLFPFLAFGETSLFTLRVTSLKDHISAGDTLPIIVTITIPPEHYIYKDQITVESGDPAQFTVISTELPPEKVKHDPFLEEEVAIYEERVEIKSLLQTSQYLPADIYNLEIKVHYQGCSKVICYAPKTETLAVPVRIGPPVKGEPPAREESAPLGEKPGPIPVPEKSEEASTFQKTLETKGILITIILIFLAGVGLSFTPCIYPMIPITIAVIGGQAAGDQVRRPFTAFLLSLVYVLGISIVYSTLGVIAASTGELFGSALQNPWVIGFIAAIFIALALSMFGVYTLQVPSFISDRLGAKRGKGFMGIFIMGLISGIIASPCIGPVLASLLVYIATTGNRFLGFWMLFIFAWGLGMPLLILGTFSGAIKALPKSGKWMVTVERIFGFLLIGAALYYLRIIIPKDVFVVLLGIFLIVIAVFSGGFDILTHRSSYFQRAKKAFGITAFIFGAYFLVGHLMIKGLILPAFSPTPPSSAVSPQEDIRWITDKEEGMRKARAENKVAMIDFWAEWCAACIEMDKITYKDSAVIQELQRFVNIKIDCTNLNDPGIKQLWATYGVVGLPTVVFINRDGTIAEDKTVTGFMNPRKFLTILRSFE
ncbi:MAG: protein-disulfide reductase DsbD [wastewater metagenome]|nr:protein-disulfide reductase DsbD [Candidatus Loosdrechtia aerotolerans]